MNCYIGVKQGCPPSPIYFGIYTYKLEHCLEVACCEGSILVGIVIIVLYVDDIILVARSLYDLDKQLNNSWTYALVQVSL